MAYLYGLDVPVCTKLVPLENSVKNLLITNLNHKE